MTVYGITRASTRKQQLSPEVQAEMIRKHCAAVQLPEPTILDEPLGTSGRTTDFRHRPQGRWLLLHAQPGDVVVVTKLDRLGRTARDILDTLEQFAKRGVRVIVIQFLGGQNIDMDSTVGRLVVIFFAGLAQFEADMIGERTAEALQRRRQQGLACNRAGFGTRKVGKRSEWDMQQLGYIAEIAERLGKGEDVVLVVADFWGRGIKDHRGLLWGQVQHKDGNGDGNGNGDGDGAEQRQGQRKPLRGVLAGHALVSPHEARRQAAPALLRRGPHDPRAAAVHGGEAPQASQRQAHHRRESRLERRTVAGVVRAGVRQ